MKLTKEKMCKIIKKDLHKEHWDDYIKMVAEPAYVCKKCGLVSSNDNMCSPAKIVIKKKKKEEANEE